MSRAATTGRAWVFGDDIDTDALAPSAYLMQAPSEIARHCLESVDPGFAAAVRPGDVFVAGDNLGVGSSREQAPQCLVALGIRAVLARSFARIFYRNALNLGLPALVCADVDRIRTGDALHVDARAGVVENRTRGERLSCDPLPPHLLEIIAAGGLLAQLKRRLASERGTG